VGELPHLREIDRRVRYLSKRLANAEVVDAAKRPKTDQVFFGATVTYAKLCTATGSPFTMRRLLR